MYIIYREEEFGYFNDDYSNNYTSIIGVTENPDLVFELVLEEAKALVCRSMGADVTIKDIETKGSYVMAKSFYASSRDTYTWSRNTVIVEEIRNLDDKFLRNKEA